MTKNMFKIVKNEGNFLNKNKIKKIKVNAYKRCFYEALENRDIRKIVFFGIKYIGNVDYEQMSYDELKDLLMDCFVVDDILQKLSFISISTIFPLEKIYWNDGMSYDYFTAIKYLEDKIPYNMICEYDVEEFYLNYVNLDIRKFAERRFFIVDKLQRLEGKYSLTDLISEKFNTPIYHKIDEGVFLGSNGEILKVSKRKKKTPSYLKIVK